MTDFAMGIRQEKESVGVLSHVPSLMIDGHGIAMLALHLLVSVLN